MGSTFDSFDQSPLGDFIQSALGVRGGQEEVAIGDLFVVHQGTTFDGVSGGIIHVYDKNTLVWTSASSSLAGGNPPVLVSFSGRLFAVNHGTSSSNRIQCYNKSSQQWEDSADWFFSDNSITVNSTLTATVLGDELFISTISSANSITVSDGGGSANIVKFDGTTFSTVGSLPVSNVSRFSSGQGHLLISVIGVTTGILWYSSDGASWSSSSIEADSAFGDHSIISESGRLLLMSSATNYDSETPLAEWSNIATDSYSYIGENNSPSGDGVSTSIGSTVYVGGDTGSPTNYDGVLAITASGVISQFDDAVFTGQNEKIATLENYGGTILAGTFSPSFPNPPNNFYQLPAYTEALGSSGTSSTSNRVHQIINAVLTIPVVTITSPSDSSFQSNPVSFTATATDLNDVDISSNIQWSTVADGVIGTGASISASITTGFVEVTATVTDSEGRTGQDKISIFVS